MPVTGPQSIRWSRDDYYRMADAGVFQDRRVELVRGEVIEMTPQKSAHATALTLLQNVLVRSSTRNRVVRMQLPLSLSVDSEPEPDIAVVEGTERDYVDAHPTTAHLVVEVSDASLRYDRETKARLYAEHGVPEYWIVNLVGECLEVRRDPVGDTYRAVSELSRGDEVRPLTAPSVVVKVSDILP